MELLGFALLLATPGVALWLGVRTLRWLVSGDPPPWHRERPAPAQRSLQTLTCDLARLQREFARIHREQPLAMARRLEAVTLAYDTTLAACCTALDLEPPPTRPFDDVERLQTEAALAQHGLRW